jgi:hypothetical protein
LIFYHSTYFANKVGAGQVLYIGLRFFPGAPGLRMTGKDHRQASLDAATLWYVLDAATQMYDWFLLLLRYHFSDFSTSA